LASAGICAADVLTVLAESSVPDRSVTAFSDYGGTVNLEARQRWLEVRRHDGSVRGTEELVILFDPASHVFWRDEAHLGILSPRQRADSNYADYLGKGTIKFYSAPHRIVAFEGLLGVRESSAHAESLDDAERKALELARARSAKTSTIWASNGGRSRPIPRSIRPSF